MAEFKKGEYLTAVKNITGNEWVYEGENFKTESFPEVLIIEAAAQAAFLFYRLNNEEKAADIFFERAEGESRNLETICSQLRSNNKSQLLLAGIKSEFFHPVSIGDQLRLETGNHKIFKDRGFVDVSAWVQETKAAVNDPS